MAHLKPIDGQYLRTEVTLRPGDRLHRLFQRLADTWIDDLSDERIVEIEHFVDGFRLTHASGSRFQEETMTDD